MPNNWEMKVVSGATILERAGSENWTKKDSAKQLEDEGSERGQNLGDGGA